MGSRQRTEEEETLLRDAFEEYYRQLCFHARRYLAREEDVKDVVMDAFLAIWNKELTFPNRLALRSFLYTAVHNASMNMIRHTSRQGLHHKRMAEQQRASYDDEDYILDRIEDEVMWRLLSAIEELPSECSRVFRMSYLEGRNIREVAEALGIAENTVRAQRARGKELLKKRLQDLYPLLALLFLN
ncbi:sigma-70 family RNA polymerase sigma factor [Alistipes sp. OttesenSCG-928-B03]|nr:sigma-70 family RNA polymerase sigma factor [Alistipes sp. OttesenSCG-928-B03]